MSVYLFDMGGQPIAFRRTWTDPFVFDLDGHWIGWFPWDDNDAVDIDGHYLGTVVDDRLVRRNDWYQRPCTGTATDPGRVERTGRPPEPHHFHNCFAYQDVRVRHHA
ncbi:hypothetical protein GEV27_01000 [Aeromicrobium sp. S22]|uniref:hypothetical protein n=1 Tax=Aeromicrobium sp. S22 TaxID=2662029 RepID=UPI00129E9472|nr:hypothetical protein [Aeromicrobium sp. S22]MRK00088.1 hypothetical protein [Aeromicrobium sp. S22]